MSAPIIIIALIKGILNTNRINRILKKCLITDPNGTDTFKYKNKYYDKVKYSQLLTKLYYKKILTYEGLEETLEDANERIKNSKDNELALIDVEILKQLMIKWKPY